MQLDHATIVTTDIESVRRFFNVVVGLDTGWRPPFRVDGDWLYLDGRPVIHVTRATLPPSASRIDHVAMRIQARGEWQALFTRLQAHGFRYRVSEVPLSGEVQVFVSVVPGVNVEFVTSRAVDARRQA
ncbi:VOC family protein [Burkholderia sp. FERM BP-3421]|jgi:catechol 2,3-dioxygenase-like lactoylglutathione lyase family enzyme|uniref:VOC family protein n=1 Tax=Burkholderia sp. FERM BP-3421 TaxID=1494466 RepID=UPI002361B580|nr:VOC family protein [Burkholderia sp. FERM BP-3421]WDD90899.1 VOC family protein [Burkholderia sp. FERM BP-3421]